MEKLLVRVAYQQRNTVHDLVLNPETTASGNFLSLANNGRDFYREFQITGRYQIGRQTLNASYVSSKATGDSQRLQSVFRKQSAGVIRANARGSASFDAPNRFLAWGEFSAPWKVTLMPVLDIHTGFPYSLVNEAREFVGRRNDHRFPRLHSFDLQAYRQFRLPLPRSGR